VAIEELQNARRRLSEAEDEIMYLRDHKINAERSVHNLERQLDDMKTEFSEIESRLREATVALSRAETQLRERTSASARAESELIAVRQRLQDHETSAKETRRQVLELQRQNHFLQQELEIAKRLAPSNVNPPPPVHHLPPPVSAPAITHLPPGIDADNPFLTM